MVKINRALDPEYGLDLKVVERLVAEGRSSIKPVDHGKVPEAIATLEALSNDSVRAAKYVVAATDYAKEYFGIKDGELEFDAALMPKQPFQNEVNRAFGYKEGANVGSPAPAAEVQKRRIINALIQGAAHGFQSAYHMLDDSVLSRAEKGAFETMIRHGDQMYFNLPSAQQARLANDPNCVVGLNSITFDNPMIVRATACFGPVLMHEIGKGVFEVLALNGLPENRGTRLAVQKAADRREHEHKDFQIGLALWKRLIAPVLASHDRTAKHTIEVFASLVKCRPEAFQECIRQITSSH